MGSRSQGGFTLIELLVASTLFFVLAAGFYTVMFSSIRGANRAGEVGDVSAEARLGFNRLVRDTREGRVITSASPTAYTVQVDFDGSGDITLFPATNPAGDYEELRYSLNPATGTLRLNGEILMRGVSCIRAADGSCTRDVFDYSSNRLEYDWNRNGVTSWQEIDAGPLHGAIGVGNNCCGSTSGTRLDSPSLELAFITNVQYALTVTEGDAEGNFRAQAQLRNAR